MMKIALTVAAAVAVLTTAPLVTPAKAQGVKMAQGVDVQIGGTATTATIGTVAGDTTPTSQLASAQVVSRSAHDSAAAWKLPRLNGTTAARSRAGSATATKRRATK